MNGAWALHNNQQKDRKTKQSERRWQRFIDSDTIDSETKKMNVIDESYGPLISVGSSSDICECTQQPNTILDYMNSREDALRFLSL